MTGTLIRWGVFIAVCVAIGLMVSNFVRWLSEDDRSLQTEPPAAEPPPEPTQWTLGDDWVGRLLDETSQTRMPEQPGDEPLGSLTEPESQQQESLDNIQATELSSRSEKEVASGRCAPAIVLGVYDWEFCAWGGARDPEMSKPEMQELIGRVWLETRTPGKPSWPPTLEEGRCGRLPDVAGCYVPASHAIEVVSGRAENFTLRVLLHELAHALISDSDEMASCTDDWTHRQSVCGHGNLFRCVADDLYVRYAGLDTAGVCGQAPDLDPGDWQLLTADEYEWGVVHSAVQVQDLESNHTLLVRCATHYEQSGEPLRQLDIVLLLDHGWTFRQAAPDYLVRIRYRFSGEEHLSDSRWLTDEDLTAAFWPEDDASSLARRFQGADRLFLRIEYTQRDTVQVEFDLGDSPALTLIQETCK